MSQSNHFVKTFFLATLCVSSFSLAMQSYIGWQDANNTKEKLTEKEENEKELTEKEENVFDCQNAWDANHLQMLTNTGYLTKKNKSVLKASINDAKSNLFRNLLYAAGYGSALTVTTIWIYQNLEPAFYLSLAFGLYPVQIYFLTASSFKSSLEDAFVCQNKLKNMYVAKKHINTLDNPD